MHPALLPSALLLGSLFIPQRSSAQFFAARMPPKLTSLAPTGAAGQPMAYVKSSRTGAPQLDSTARRLLVQHGVREVVKVRLDKEGQVQDTVSRQLVDAQGNLRATSVATRPHQHRTLMPNEKQTVIATAGKPAPVVLPYRPAGRDVLPVTMLDQAIRTQDGPNSDAQWNQKKSRRNPVTGLRTRPMQTETYNPHPDTSFYFHFVGNDEGELHLSGVAYLVRNEERPLEAGQISLNRFKKTRPAGPDGTSPYLAPARQALRARRGTEALHRWAYNAQNLLVREEINTRLTVYQLADATPQMVNTLVAYTYNSNSQLIGREETVSAIRVPARTTFTVYSYSPQGLLLGETTNVASEKPVFYSYQYAYHQK